MNTEIIKTEKRPVLPAVGEAWKHKNFDSVYIRIDDHLGKRALGDTVDYHFYSFDVTDSTIRRTDKESCDVILLEPADGALKFKEIE